MSVSDTEAVKRLPAWSTTSAVLLGFSGPPGRWAAGFDPHLSPGRPVPPSMDPHIPVYVQCLFQSQLLKSFHFNQKFLNLVGHRELKCSDKKLNSHTSIVLIRSLTDSKIPNDEEWYVHEN